MTEEEKLKKMYWDAGIAEERERVLAIVEGMVEYCNCAVDNNKTHPSARGCPDHNSVGYNRALSDLRERITNNK